MSRQDYFVSCDWGTSNFRLRLVEISTLNVITEIKTNEGLKILSSQLNQQNEKSQADFLLDYLSEKTSQLKDFVPAYTIIISGMASSTLGIKNLAYGEMPIDNSGLRIPAEKIQNNYGFNIILTSGMRTTNDIMRGEEVQALGLLDDISAQETGILLLPGTHSKHISFDGNRYTGFTTYMTGELFELLSQHSILNGNIEKNTWSNENENSFRDGLILGFENKLTSKLFSIRSKSILHDVSKSENYFYLSGLLIGDELRYLKDKQGKIFLAATKSLTDIYQFALSTLFSEEHIVVIDPSDFDKAVFKGQLKIINQHESK